MTPDLAGEKQAMRARIKAGLREMPPAVRTELSARCVAHIRASEAWARAETVMLYVPLPSEVDLTPLVGADAKRCCAPRADWEASTMQACTIGRDPAHGEIVGLVETPFGVREPGPGAEVVQAREIDLVLVPGLGFDERGGRLGRGGGFYDRFLAALGEHTLVCGVCFSVQMMDAIPMQRNDVRVHMLLCENGLKPRAD